MSAASPPARTRWSGHGSAWPGRVAWPVQPPLALSATWPRATPPAISSTLARGRPPRRSCAGACRRTRRPGRSRARRSGRRGARRAATRRRRAPVELLQQLGDGDRPEDDRRRAGLGGLRRALVEAVLGGIDQRGEVEPGGPERDGLRASRRADLGGGERALLGDVGAMRRGDRHARGARELDREPDPGGVLELPGERGRVEARARRRPSRRAPCRRPAAAARGRRPARGRAARVRPRRRRRGRSPASLRSVVEAAPTRPSASTTSSAVACTRSETPCPRPRSRRSHQTVAWPSPSRRATALRASAERSCSVGAIAARSLPVVRNPASGRGWASMRCAGSLLHTPWTITSRSLRCSGRTPGGRSRASASASA